MHCAGPVLNPPSYVLKRCTSEGTYLSPLDIPGIRASDGKRKRLAGFPVSRFLQLRTAVIDYFLWCFFAFGAGAVLETGFTADSSTGVRPEVSRVAPSGMRVVAEDFVPAVPV